jgi:hypothetical protein
MYSAPPVPLWSVKAFLRRDVCDGIVGPTTQYNKARLSSDDETWLTITCVGLSLSKCALT